jgi:hypothetical protein
VAAPADIRGLSCPSGYVECRERRSPPRRADANGASTMQLALKSMTWCAQWVFLSWIGDEE